MTNFFRLLSILITTSLLTACGMLIPYQTTETISIDDTETVTFKHQGKYMDTFPILEIALQNAREGMQPPTKEKLQELSQETQKAVLEMHGTNIISHDGHIYQVEGTSQEVFKSEQDADKEIESLKGDKLKELFKSLNISEAVYNEAGNRQIKLLLNKSNDLKSWDDEDEKQDSERRAKIQNSGNKLFEKAVYTIIIETDQRLKEQNAQRIENIEGSAKKRYTWTFNYEDIIKARDNTPYIDPLIFILD